MWCVPVEYAQVLNVHVHVCACVWHPGHLGVCAISHCYYGFCICSLSVMHAFLVPIGGHTYDRS